MLVDLCVAGAVTQLYQHAVDFFPAVPINDRFSNRLSVRIAIAEPLISFLLPHP